MTAMLVLVTWTALAAPLAVIVGRAAADTRVLAN